MKRVLVGLVVLAALAVGVFYFNQSPPAPPLPGPEPAAHSLSPKLQPEL